MMQTKQAALTLLGLATPSSGLVVPVALARTAVPLARRSQFPELTVLVDGLDSLVDSGVAANTCMGILVNPLGVCFSSTICMADDG